MTTPKKFIPVSSCADCPPTTRHDCVLFNKDIEQGYRRVYEKTIHPSCPLDDYKEREQGSAWISVEDRLPETRECSTTSETVLMCIDGLTVIMGNIWKCGDVVSWQYVYGISIKNKKVTHWQPLPGKPEK